VFQPFFVFQLYSVILWCFEAYYIFAGCIAFLATVSLITTLIETHSTLVRISEMARFECPVNVLQDGQWIRMSSASLVPGDVVDVEDEWTVPCDLALLDGGCVVNEAMLTGESVPVVKAALDLDGRDAADVFTLGADNQRTLFAATKILQVKPREKGARVMALAVRTGFQTAKGSLVLSILFPRPSFFNFMQQTYMFVMGVCLVSMI
jgi:cation-transporting ATPase 13A2